MDAVKSLRHRLPRVTQAPVKGHHRGNSGGGTFGCGGMRVKGLVATSPSLLLSSTDPVFLSCPVVKGFGLFVAREVQRNQAVFSGGANNAAIFNARLFPHYRPVCSVEILFSFLPSHAAPLHFGEIVAMGIYRLPILDNLPVYQLVDSDTGFSVFEYSPGYRIVLSLHFLPPLMEHYKARKVPTLAARVFFCISTYYAPENKGRGPLFIFLSRGCYQSTASSSESTYGIFLLPTSDKILPATSPVSVASTAVMRIPLA